MHTTANWAPAGAQTSHQSELRQTMFAIEMKIVRPIGEVFTLLARIEDSPLWYSAVKSVDRLHPSPVGVGTRFRFRRALGGVDALNEVEVTAYDPNQRLELSSISGPTPFVYRYRLTPAANNTTHLRLDGAISGEGFSGPMVLLRPLAESFFRRGMIVNLKSLKRLIEDASSSSLRTSTDTIQTSPPSKGR